MADIYGSHFTYGGVSSADRGLIFANVETDRFTQMAGTIAGVTIFNKSGKRNYLIDDDYSGSPLSFDIDIVTDDERTLTLEERRTIEKWMFNRHGYKKLYIYHNDECGDPVVDDEYSETIEGSVKRLYMNCRFVNPTYLEYQGGIVGYRATLEADSGYWWQDAITKVYTLNNANASSSTQITVDVDTDIDDYTYPRISVVMNTGGGDFSITNNTDDGARLTSFTDIAANATVIIDSEFNYVSGQYYLKFQDQNFPRLLDGSNTITVRGAVKSVTFTFNNRRNLL